MLILLQWREQVSWLSAIVGGIIGIGTGVAAFAVAWVYFKTGLEEKLTIKYKGLYEAEKADNDRLAREASSAKQAREAAEAHARTVEAERQDILLDYTQLTQLFAKKSVILETLTGIYTRMADSLQSGEPERVRALLSFLSPPAKDDIHKTNPPQG